MSKTQRLPRRKNLRCRSLPVSSNHILTVDNFYSDCKSMRGFFEQQFQDPKQTESKRFVWDYWHVPDQYTLIRTPAYHYFPDSMYMRFHKHLVHWGRKHLGCWDVSPPWISYYVDGCKQEFHSDVPHGPWAYVFSLTPWKNRKFTGGETLILKPEVLSYWSNFGSSQDRELKSFVDKVPSLMNRLTVFDPRYPHGVTEVRGVRDPLEARVVIHGWFMEPKTYIEGPLKAAACEKILNEKFDDIQDLIFKQEPVQGTVSLMMDIGTDGNVKKIKFGTNTLLTLQGQVPKVLNKQILAHYQKMQFPVAKAESSVTLPLIFN